MNPHPPSRGAKDYVLPFLIIISIGVIAALLIRIWGLWGDDRSSGGLALSGKAELSDVVGGVEVYLPVAEAWKITNSSAILSAGESVRTDANGSAVLSFDDGSILTLASSSELVIESLQNSITKKKVDLSLTHGSAWVVAGTTNADLEITSELLKISDADGEFILNYSENESTASAIEGGFTVTILDPQNPKNSELKNFVVETGETLEISERRVNLLRIGGEIDLVKATPAEITKSSFYLTMAGEVAETETEGEKSDLDPDLVTTDAERDTLPAPLVTTGGGNITAVDEPVGVSGKVSPKIVKVEVKYENDKPFLLSQFEAGSGEWSYNAARKFENLKVGINNYTVVGSDEEGNKTPLANFQINFNPEGVEESSENTEALSETPEAETPAETTETDGIPAVGDETFAAPTVSEPADGAIFTESPVHFEGTAPAGTKQILINEYALSRFEEGSTSWYYNADVKYENLEIGENEFEIVAVSEAGDRSSITIKITFAPEEESTTEED